jgi:hypothetical protein
VQIGQLVFVGAVLMARGFFRTAMAHVSNLPQFSGPAIGST